LIADFVFGIPVTSYDVRSTRAGKSIELQNIVNHSVQIKIKFAIFASLECDPGLPFPGW
jgi:hypothetical protein